MKSFLVTASFCFFDFFLVPSSVSTISARTQARPRATREPITFSQGDETLGLWRNEIWETVQSSGPVSLAPQGILVLATERTKMLDILSGLKRYRRGWDIANPHYWTVS
ncbi:hypothetical protein M0R45_022341 [Rubus argutus]|uniref:Uncharacterized protein n=1 Tax=Rubus argutus TaxID=59490 RepID=A0AAW1XGA0_RUBAR